MSVGGKRRAVRAVVAAVALCAATSAGAVAAAPASAATDIGVRDFSYSPMTGSPTGSKAESKLWFNDGTWWASMFDPASQDHHIFRLDRTTQHWLDTGTAIDTRTSTRADALWTGAKLYVASHVFTTTAATTTSANAGKLWRFSYDPAAKRYTRDAGFPVDINAAKTETLSIDRDSTGRLWATWTLGSRVWVNHTTSSDTAWGTPYVIPGSTAMVNDDISAIIHFGGNRIGVMWSNQADHRFWFAVHADGAGDAAADWKLEQATSGATGTPTSDDHINLKADAAGKVYAAVKTSDSGTRPLVLLLVRGTTGTWNQNVFGIGRDSHTRPLVLLDEEHQAIHMFATCPQPPNTSGQSGGDICEKTSAMSPISFPTGIGTAVIRDAASAEMNDVSATKQDVDSASGIVIMANNPVSHFYWHRDLSLGTAPGPGPAPTADFTASPTSGDAPLTVQFTDASSPAPATWSWSFGDGATATVQNPAHQYTQPGVYSVKLTVTNADGVSGTITKTNLITVNSPPPPPPPGGTTTFTPVADAQVRDTSPTQNFGGATTLRVRLGTVSSPGTYRSFIKFDVAGIAGPMRAKLRLFVTDASPDTGSVFSVDNTWSESTLTWANQPPLPASRIGAAGATTTVGVPVDIDIGTIPGDGTYSFALTSASTNSAIFSSREGANPPQLVLSSG